MAFSGIDEMSESEEESEEETRMRKRARRKKRRKMERRHLCRWKRRKRKVKAISFLFFSLYLKELVMFIGY